MVTLSVVVPVHNGGHPFRACLDSIDASRTDADELIVVADGESDGAWRYARHFDARVLVNEKPGGPARARNQGAAEATGDVLFFVDADVTLHPDTLPRVRAAFEHNPDLSALIGSYDDEPAHPGFVSQYRNLLHHYTHQRGSEEANTFWGACGAIRRSVFMDIGGFNESYDRPCIEDIELGYRLKDAGHTIKLYKDIQVKHHKPWDLVSMIKTDVFSRGIPWTELILRYDRLDNDLNTDQSSRLSVALSGLLLAALPASLPYPKARTVAVGSGAGLLWLNRAFYRFLWQQRSASFALKSIPLHILYFAYSGFSFAVGAARTLLYSPTAAAPSPSNDPRHAPSHAGHASSSRSRGTKTSIFTHAVES